MAKNHIVLFEPEIPQNTGNIMRTCVGTNTVLHLIRPFGFHLDDAHLKRSAVNYLEYLEYYIYDDYEDFLKKNPGGKKYYFSRYGKKTPHELELGNKDEEYYFIFGKESTGLDKQIILDNFDSCIRLPMTDKIRALNLSNCAAIVIYEALRQQDYNDLKRVEPDTLKGEDWIFTQGKTK